MARPRATLVQRGLFYAEKKTGVPRYELAHAWVIGYKAAQNDARENRRRGKRR